MSAFDVDKEEDDDREVERDESTAPSAGRRVYLHWRPDAVSDCKSALPGGI